MTPYELMAANAVSENECYEQARRELAGLKCDPIMWIRAVAKRAQEIKQWRANDENNTRRDVPR